MKLYHNREKISYISLFLFQSLDSERDQQPTILNFYGTDYQPT